MIFPSSVAAFVLLATLFVGETVGASEEGAASFERPRHPRTVLVPDRVFDVLSPPPWPKGLRTPLVEAAEKLGARKIQLAGTEVHGVLLVEMAGADPQEPMARVMREALGGPVDPEDFIFFLDDLLREDRSDLWDETVWITPSRARKAGFFLHPDDVFKRKPRRYGSHGPVSTARPRLQAELPAAEDDERLGPNWTMRFRNPVTEEERIRALETKGGAASFATRIRSLVEQLRAQGARVELTSTVRSPERGYLMWGAFRLGKAQDSEAVAGIVAELEAANREWGLDVPIQWKHPDGWEATRLAAREMADTYQVVFATETGARFSDHYTGRAVDLVAVALPRHLELVGMDGEIGLFDLSDPDQSRDLSLSPKLIEWIEAHFELRKLREDYPHWVNAQ